MMVEGFIGIGSNLGDRLSSILQAVDFIDEAAGVTVFRLSTVLETSPVGLEEQSDFLNAVVQVRSDRTMTEMLDLLLNIEVQLGRDRSQGVPGGPRSIDLDLLLWGQLTSEAPGLCVPHPRLHERAFVLVPMVELAPDMVHPTLGRSMQELLATEIEQNGDLMNRCRPAGPGPLRPA